jgi:uncharacterized protein (DUF4415 family)
MRKKSTAAMFDEDAPIRQADIDVGKSVLRKRVSGHVIPAKKRVTLYLDLAAIEHFKEMDGERGYQTLINETLKTSLYQANLEGTLRKGIREE